MNDGDELLHCRNRKRQLKSALIFREPLPSILQFVLLLFAVVVVVAAKSTSDHQRRKHYGHLRRSSSGGTLTYNTGDAEARTRCILRHTAFLRSLSLADDDFDTGQPPVMKPKFPPLTAEQMVRLSSATHFS